MLLRNDKMTKSLRNVIIGHFRRETSFIDK